MPTRVLRPHSAAQRVGDAAAAPNNLDSFLAGNKRYNGKFRFPKHFYPVLADLEDGSKEWRCAMALDEHPKVARWVRNLDSDPVNGFWPPTSSGRFYPDFVCELADGRVFVAEYKGDHLRAAPKELQKSGRGSFLTWPGPGPVT